VRHRGAFSLPAPPLPLSHVVPGAILLPNHMDILKRLQAALAGRYEVEHELGRGGMAVVFLGHDLRLERRVAIKVFEQEGASGEGTERFLREIRVAAQLQHPNILPVFESGEGEGLVRAADGMSVWAGTYDADVADLMTAARQVATEASAQIGERLSSSARR